MLSGLKFIPRDEVDKTHDEKSNDKKKKKSRDDGSDRIKKRSKKKWYSSQEDSDSGSDKRRRRKKKEKKGKSKKSKRREYSSSSDDDDDDDDHDGDDDDDGEKVVENKNTVRKEMGLEWMLRPKEHVVDAVTTNLVEETQSQSQTPAKVNPKELNPYFKNDGSGYPEGPESQSQTPVSVVGDGGASWRLKALKRAQEQAAREGKDLDEVVGERWGSLGKLAVSVASASAAPSHAHLHAINNRKRHHHPNESERDNKPAGRMRVPRPDESLSWGKRKSQSQSQSMSAKDAGVISCALSSLQKFTDDGSFIEKFKSQHQNDDDKSQSQSQSMSPKEAGVISEEEAVQVQPALSANQLAAKAMQLRIKGKHQEADKLLKEAQQKSKSNTDTNPQGDGTGTTSRYIMHGLERRKTNKEEDADMHVARSIMQNKQYSSISQGADDEYDYNEGPKRKKKVKSVDQSTIGNRFDKRILTEQERCNFCFENPNRPKHLVVAIANFTYLTLPQWQPLVPGHCCILPMQHELATRSVDDNVWDEIRNFKKCLVMMFAKQDRELVFMETVTGLAKQRRHCLVECIPLPSQVAKQAPLYFKKAIDEAEEEWSQHNAKKLIDTSEKGLRASIPRDFPYFHVEFGLKNGFVHVIDDEENFKSGFGLNVVRGMLRLEMQSRHKRDSVDTQKEAVASFARDWEPYDWTKQLD